MRADQSSEELRTRMTTQCNSIVSCKRLGICGVSYGKKKIGNPSCTARYQACPHQPTSVGYFLARGDFRLPHFFINYFIPAAGSVTSILLLCVVSSRRTVLRELGRTLHFRSPWTHFFQACLLTLVFAYYFGL